MREANGDSFSCSDDAVWQGQETSDSHVKHIITAAVHFTFHSVHTNTHTHTHRHTPAHSHRHTHTYKHTTQTDTLTLHHLPDRKRHSSIMTASQRKPLL